MVGDLGALAGMRVGFGLDIRRFEEGRPLRLGGAEIDHPRGLSGPGDGDAICRAVLDALLSASGMPDLATIFPDDDPDLKAAEGLMLLSQTATALLRKRLETVLNLSVQVVCQEPELGAERQRIRSLLAAALHVEPSNVTVAFGQSAPWADSAGNALVAYAHLLCVLKTEAPKGKRAGKARDKDEGLPSRAAKFKKAIETKLPPLPPAPPPEPGANLIIYTDGASRGNPGPSATGFVVLDEQGRLVHEGGSAVGDHTNNEAEYLAVKEAAAWVDANLGRDLNLEFRSDAELIVKQLSGQWKVKDPELKQLVMQIMSQLMFFSSFTLKHVPRRENQRADALANRALGEK